MRARSSSSMPDFPARAPPATLPPGTARRVSPSRFGQERSSPTLRNPSRILSLGLGSGRETRGRQPDGGVGDRAVWSTGRSRTIRQRQSRYRRVLHSFYSNAALSVKIKTRTKPPYRSCSAAPRVCPKLLHRSEDARQRINAARCLKTSRGEAERWKIRHFRGCQGNSPV